MGQVTVVVFLLIFASAFGQDDPTDHIDLDLVIKVTSRGMNSSVDITPEMLNLYDNDDTEGEDITADLEEELAVGETGLDMDEEDMMDDMVVSEEQREWLTGEASGNRTKRAGHMLPPESMFWPKGEIPYKIEFVHFKIKEEREQLREAMDHWEEVSCIKFVEKSYGQSFPTYLYFIHTERGCFSTLGMQPQRGPQRLSLKEPGCRYFGTYLHELGHAIGLVHEHQLPTRAQFVHYFMTNVDPLKANQLELLKGNVINTFNTPYDLGSIMHYDLLSFSNTDVNPTLGVENPWLFQHIGRRYSNMVSFADAKTVNELYKCDAQCDAMKQRACVTPNYLDKDCECMTPAKFDAKYCKDEEGMEAFCAGLVPSGQCDIKNIEHHRKCRRSCDFCPRFLPGESAITNQQKVAGKSCMDRYRFPMKCAQWKQLCSTSRWMHRNCRRTCGACSSQWGDCPNYDPDYICDRHMSTGKCKLEGKLGDFMKARCQDSCGTCNFRKVDESCRNELDDAQCAKFAAEYGCEKNPEEMFIKCASTCRRCYFNKGSCNNKGTAFACLGWGLKNYCTGGDPEEKAYARSQCGKTCDSC